MVSYNKLGQYSVFSCQNFLDQGPNRIFERKKYSFANAYKLVSEKRYLKRLSERAGHNKPIEEIAFKKDDIQN